MDLKQLPVYDNEDSNYPTKHIENQEVETGTETLTIPFNPVSLKLNPHFRLSNFHGVQGQDGRLSFEELKPVFESLQEEDTGDEQTDKPKFMSIGVDVTVLDYGLYCVVKTHSFMYSFIDEPYILGQIACANVLSSLFSVGISTCNTIHMMLSIPIQMTDEEAEIVMPIVVKGFRDTASIVGADVNAGQTAYNPWLFIGGTATSIVETNAVVHADCAAAGDVLVLTKPLGIMIAIQTYHWMNKSERWNRIKLVLNEDEVMKSYKRALECMKRLNNVAARLLHTYGAHGAVEVGTCGLLGHAKQLAQKQKNDVSFVIHNLPVLAKMATVARICGNMFSLPQGLSPEISGGLLVTLPREQAASYCKEMEKEDGFQAWIIGIVEKGNKTARIIEKPRIIEIPPKEKESELW